MEQFILKEQIKEQIGERNVKAALFYTFNFDPKFFENYVMPLFVPGKDFGNETVHNKIIWRNCIRENLIPPITVFCDFYAKSNTEAPTLGYDVFCIKVPASPNRITNFHPKDIFILVWDEKSQKESLIHICGSGNLTPGGWCDNQECVSIRELTTKRTPNHTTTNIYQKMIEKVGKMSGSTYYTEAENLIYEHLRYVDEDFVYFSSLSESFTDWIDRNIFQQGEIHEVEIISPYFSNDTGLVQLLKEKGVRIIKCLIPALKTNEVLLNKEMFLAYQEAGIKWSIWNDRGLAEEVRNNHAKVYRFHGANQTVYTIIGSVNYTHPAWKQYNEHRNEANIESAMLFYTKLDNTRWLRSEAINMDHFQFYYKEDLENPTSAYTNRNAPDLYFSIDWKKGEFRCKGKKITSDCFFVSICKGAQINNGEQVFEMSDSCLKLLAQNALIEVREVKEEAELLHYYYVQQLNIENKPLGIKLNAATILKYWFFLEDEYSKENITRRLVESMTTHSGIEHESSEDKKSALNEMASHFNALVQLEKFLFKEIKNKHDRREHFQKLRYYLLSENIDTVNFYLSDLHTQITSKTIQNSFYWMILQIFIKTFYEAAETWKYKDDIDKEYWRSFLKDIRQKKGKIDLDADSVVKTIPGLEKKQQWVKDQIITNYD